MSSNELHITRANYEAYFLLYVDGELTPAQCDAVEAFAALHPDLQEELDLLLTTRLDAETISFDKSALMADSMKQNVIDESLLLYIDDELNGDEKKKVEQQLASDTTFQYQHNLLLQTKLSAEAITYPNKAELYRKSERRIRPIVWTRSAAAAVFVLMTSSYFWYQNQHLITDGNTTAIYVNTTAPANTAPATEGTPDVAIAPATSAQAADAPDTTEETEGKASDVATRTTTSATVAQYAANSATSSSAPANEDIRVDVAVTRSTNIAEPAVTQSLAAASAPQQIINNTTVTSSQPTPLNNKEFIADNSGYDQAVALETENHKRGSVKGFLRKATRFIERRTGVATTNDDDELLIGAVAIKLK